MTATRKKIWPRENIIHQTDNKMSTKCNEKKNPYMHHSSKKKKDIDEKFNFRYDEGEIQYLFFELCITLHS